MSSHREAPEISKDPTADSTDVYAWIDPNNPTRVTLIANYIPLQGPDGGPNFYEFDDQVGYYINIDNTGNGVPDLAYKFQFTTVNTNPNTFLYNTGAINNVTDTTWNRKQTYELSRINYTNGVPVNTTSLGSGLTCPPCNIGPLSTPNYHNLTNQAIHLVSGGGYGAKVYAGQRAEGFYVDLGSVFDLGNLRGFEGAHAGWAATGLMASMPGVNSTDQLNVHSLALQVPITDVVAGGTMPANPSASNAVIGVWTSATRPASRMFEPANGTGGGGGTMATGAEVQVSRLGNPLVNELIIALADKDAWNASLPKVDSSFAARFSKPELATLLPVLYPGVFPKLQAFNRRTTGNMSRGDIVAILLTGIPSGVVPGFPGNHLAQTGVMADELRLNVAIPPAAHPSNLGLIGGDIAGFPNGRRVFDDVATIELRAVAGATLPLVDPTFHADAAAGAVSFSLTSSPTDLAAMNTEFYDPFFPFLGQPHAGFDAHTARAVNTHSDAY